MTKKELFSWGTTGPWITEPETDTQYKIEQIRDTLYIAFQGSISDVDWRQNFQAWKKPYKNQDFAWFAHAGFLKKWKAVEDKITETVSFSGASRVVVFGFSQGAALATLCHESIWYNFIQYRSTILTYVYGCPRVVGLWNHKKLAPRFERIKRYEATGDLVTRVPPAIFGYRHVGKAEKLKSPYHWWQFEKNHMSYGGLL